MKTYRYVFGELKDGGIRICKCGEVTLEDDMHLCKLTEEEVTDENPLDVIENESFWKDTGKQGLLIYRGAVEAGATSLEAATVLRGFYAGMFKGVLDNKEEDDEEKVDDTQT